jgi:hypothetical protein
MPHHSRLPNRMAVLELLAQIEKASISFPSVGTW